MIRIDSAMFTLTNMRIQTKITVADITGRIAILVRTDTGSTKLNLWNDLHEGDTNP